MALRPSYQSPGNGGDVVSAVRHRRARLHDRSSRRARPTSSPPSSAASSRFYVTFVPVAHHDRLRLPDLVGAKPAAARRPVGRQSLLHGLPVHAHEPRRLALSVQRRPRRRGDRAELRHRDRLDHHRHRAARDLQPDAPRSGRGRADDAARAGRCRAARAPRARRDRGRVRLHPAQRPAGGVRFLRARRREGRRGRRAAARPRRRRGAALRAPAGRRLPALRRHPLGRFQHDGGGARFGRASARDRHGEAVAERRRDLQDHRRGGREVRAAAHAGRRDRGPHGPGDRIADRRGRPVLGPVGSPRARRSTVRSRRRRAWRKVRPRRSRCCASTSIRARSRTAPRSRP